MDKSARDKAIEKIRKCLALSHSSNEHEAARALKHAQALMRKHELSLDDLDDFEFQQALVICRDYEFGRKKPMTISSVVSVISNALGVRAIWEPWTDTATYKVYHALRYFGKRDRVIIAEHAHAVVYRAVGHAWRRFLDDRGGLRLPRGARASFYAGWCLRVLSKVEELVISEKENEGIDKAMKKEYGTEELGTSETGTKSVFASVVEEGYRAGEDFEMNKPIGQDRRRLEKL